MKIRDLLEAEFQTNYQKFKSDNSYDVDAQRYRYRNRPFDPLSHLKSGAYGKIYRNKDDPHQIIKVPHVAAESDAYYSFIEYVTKTGIAKSNPHFPRVYDIKSWTDAYDRFKYKIKMETLKHYREIDDEISESMLHRYCDLSDTDDPFGTLADTIKTAIKFNDYSTIKDKKLIEACEFVSTFLSINKKYVLDIHGGNLMIRLSPYPQLVFVDPVASY